MSLARRIDYEAARAAEWRDGELVPLPGAERVEAELAGDLSSQSPAAPAIERSRRLLRAPGDKAMGWLAVAVLLLVALAATAGVQVARLALGEPSEGPVNVVWFLGHALGLQTLFLLLTLLVSLAGRTALGRALSGTLSLGAMALSAAVRLAAPRAGAEGRVGADVLDRLRGLRELRPLALAASHGAWLGFNVALLAAASLILSAEHHAFAWQSTFVQDEARAERLLRTLTLPSTVWPGAPSSEQVAVSRYDPEAGAFLDDGGDPKTALDLRQGWSTQLLASVAGWGLVPRLLLLLACWGTWRARRRRLLPEAGDPYLEAVLARLGPAVTTDSDAVEQEALPEQPIARSTDAPADLRSHAACWLGAAPGQDPVEALLGRSDPEWRSLPRLDSRANEAAAREALEAPALLVLLCDWSTTPDASLGRFLAEASPARTVLVLTGGAAFRATRRGATPEGLRARRQAWEKAAARWAVAAEDLIDFDVDSATPDSRAQLLARLGAEGATATAPGGFVAALNEIRDAARGWERSFAGLVDDELEAAQLRAAASIRSRVESCFAELPALPTASPVIVTAARAVLGESLGGAGEEALGKALGEAARVGRWMAKLKDVDPRWAASGLVLGLVAGPLGGAIAAGSAGLVAGASLTSTLAPLGAALGSALSLREREEEDSPEPAEDALGLPARAGVLRALELHLQGSGEEAVAAALSELDRSEAGHASLVTAAQVSTLCDAAAEIGGRT